MNQGGIRFAKVGDRASYCPELLELTVAMTHRQVLELAGWLAEHGAEVAGRCRGIPVAGLRQYLDARNTQFQTWMKVLHENHPTDEFTEPGDKLDAGRDLLTTIRAIAVHGVLVRVASTVLDAIGERMDIPLARDVANRTARVYGKVVQAAMAAVALRTEIPARELSGLDRLGRLCDRLSDLFCGTLLTALRCDRFVVDPERAADFAQTFGRQPALVRVPLRDAAVALPADIPIWRGLAAEVERSLLACLPILVNYRSARADNLTDLVQTFGPTIVPFSERTAGTPADRPDPPSRPLAFPTLSVAQFLRKMRTRRET